MIKKVNKISVILILFTFMCGLILPCAFAQNPIRKLGRGMANTLTGFLELPANIVDAAEEDGFIAAATYGIVKGFAMTLLRTTVGVYETVTFVIPLPWGYGPILEPEFMMSEERL